MSNEYGWHSDASDCATHLHHHICSFSKMDAKYENGVLSITCAKQPEQMPVGSDIWLAT